MTMKELPWSDASAQDRPVRELVAALVRAFGALLDRLALRLLRAENQPADEAQAIFEFHAEAGAPEGALYVNGRLFGHLDGVTRL